MEFKVSAMTSDAEQHEERRQSMRLDMEKELIDIQWQDEAGNLMRKKIACLDFSKGGVRLDCDQAIPLHTKAEIIFKAAESKSQTLKGQIIRCLKQENGWFEIALRLDE